ncbi:hypothetical protein CTI12_AA281190 [Artemisia annua]|uniref:Uncharacterized protein n=1 Tax=Artemisia annua TaxID=35608 RepID=A0A2U1NCV5_ARTAN|nr:hypothetical protein CTI12_AA281190 [Artemisia annua]
MWKSPLERLAAFQYGDHKICFTISTHMRLKFCIYCAVMATAGKQVKGRLTSWIHQPFQMSKHNDTWIQSERKQATVSIYQNSHVIWKKNRWHPRRKDTSFIGLAESQVFFIKVCYVSTIPFLSTAWYKVTCSRRLTRYSNKESLSMGGCSYQFDYVFDCTILKYPKIGHQVHKLDLLSLTSQRSPLQDLASSDKLKITALRWPVAIDNGVFIRPVSDVRAKKDIFFISKKFCWLLLTIIIMCLHSREKLSHKFIALSAMLLNLIKADIATLPRRSPNIFTSMSMDCYTFHCVIQVKMIWRLHEQFDVSIYLLVILRNVNNLMEEINKLAGAKELEFPRLELMRFINYLLQTLMRDALTLFNVLKQKFSSSIQRDPTFNELKSGDLKLNLETDIMYDVFQAYNRVISGVEERKEHVIVKSHELLNYHSFCTKQYIDNPFGDGLSYFKRSPVDPLLECSLAVRLQ